MNKIFSSTFGYDLYEAFPGQWVFDFKDGEAYHGNFKEIVKYMIYDLDFYSEEIELAVKEMTFYDMNGCHFGLNKTFIFTLDKKIELEKAS